MTNSRYIITMPDGSEYAVPVMIIARSRAAEYAGEFDSDVERSLNEDTLPLFQEDVYSIRDWAQNNMNWDEVEKYAVKITTPDQKISFQDGWLNGRYRFDEADSAGPPPAAFIPRD